VKKILVAIDGSDAALKAVHVACEIAGAAKADVTVAHVTTPLPFLASLDQSNIANIRLREGEWSERVLQEGVEKAREAGVEATKAFLAGSAAEAIANHASEKGFDLVVIGSRGRGEVSRTVLGSVSNRLVHICNKPILIVR
jgi:nucleotide-binding universal stress UspA family protein